ncbi:MAG: MOFRL family protein [Desulfurococcaceae archaeon]
MLVSIIKNISVYGKLINKPAALLAGGETVVTVKGGIGGRNQELCLSHAISLRNLPGFAAACFITGGVDEVRPAAGALVDGWVVDEALNKGLDPWRNLIRFTSFGTNDFVQYKLAVDMNNPRMSYLYNELEPSALWITKQTVNLAGEKTYI